MVETVKKLPLFWDAGPDLGVIPVSVNIFWRNLLHTGHNI
jgi:hypothetical protein